MATAIGLVLMQRSRKRVIAASRSLPEEEEIEKTVYFRATSSFNKQTVSDWYIIKLSSKDCTQKKWTKTEAGLVLCRKRRRTRGEGSKDQLDLKSILKNTTKHSLHSRFAAVGSTIYCTSAANNDCRDVLALDTSNPTTSLQWQAVPSMNIRRQGYFSEAVTADDGKIYVFGGGFHDLSKLEPGKERFEVEVFDPSKNTWEAINPPTEEMRPLHCNHLVFSVYDYTSRRIILGSIGGFFIVYDLRDASWGVLPKKFHDSMDTHISRPAFFDNTLYWIQIVDYDTYRCGLCAYDLDLGMIIDGHIMDVDPSFCRSYSTSMHFSHFRGDEFYLIWLYSGRWVRCERMRVLKRFDMEKREGSLECSVLSTKTYMLETEARSIDAVVL